jgi:hypothetical protein
MNEEEDQNNAVSKYKCFTTPRNPHCGPGWDSHEVAYENRIDENNIHLVTRCFGLLIVHVKTDGVWRCSSQYPYYSFCTEHDDWIYYREFSELDLAYLRIEQNKVGK